MFALLAAPALAQSVIVDDAVLTATPEVPDGMGAPTVILDGARRELLMLFETRTTPPAGCAEGWRIGAATSTDGRTWTEVSGGVLRPNATAPCGPRAPSAVLLDDGSLAVIFTATEPGVDDGVGILTWDAGETTLARVPALDGLREPSLARSDGIWQVLGVDDALGLVRAHSSDLEHWTVDATASLPTGSTTWSADAVSSPALGCLDDPSYPWSVHYGGRSAPDTAWGWAVADRWDTYFVGSATDTWPSGDGWIAFDVIETEGGDLVWFEHLGVDGLPRIGFATVGTPTVTTARDRDCVTSAP